MGRTSVEGEIRIEPPLTWGEIKDHKDFLGGPDHGDCPVRLVVDEREIQTEGGTLIKKSAEALVPRWEDAFKAYTLTDSVQAVIDTFPGHTFTGRLDCCGEEGELWRVVVHSNRAQRIEPRIVWPDEEN